MEVDAVVVGILGSAHHDATRSGTPPSSAETICHGGTFRCDGFEISTTPLDSVAVVAALLFDSLPRLRTSCSMSAGPPFFTICRFAGSVTTLAFTSAAKTAATSALLRFNAKKCWLTKTSLSFTHPSVFPSVLRGSFTLPDAGQEGVETCSTIPLPVSFHANM